MVHDNNRMAEMSIPPIPITYYITLCPQPYTVMGETTTLSRDMIVLLDNVQILVISKKLVYKLHSVGFITLLWLGRYSVDY